MFNKDFTEQQHSIALVSRFLLTQTTSNNNQLKRALCPCYNYYSLPSIGVAMSEERLGASTEFTDFIGSTEYADDFVREIIGDLVEQVHVRIMSNGTQEAVLDTAVLETHNNIEGTTTIMQTDIGEHPQLEGGALSKTGTPHSTEDDGAFEVIEDIITSSLNQFNIEEAPSITAQEHGKETVQSARDASTTPEDVLAVSQELQAGDTVVVTSGERSAKKVPHDIPVLQVHSIQDTHDNDHPAPSLSPTSGDPFRTSQPSTPEGHRLSKKAFPSHQRLSTRVRTPQGRPLSSAVVYPREPPNRTLESLLSPRELLSVHREPERTFSPPRERGYSPSRARMLSPPRERLSLHREIHTKVPLYLDDSHTKPASAPPTRLFTFARAEVPTEPEVSAPSHEPLPEVEHVGEQPEVITDALIPQEQAHGAPLEVPESPTTSTITAEAQATTETESETTSEVMSEDICSSTSTLVRTESEVCYFTCKAFLH